MNLSKYIHFLIISAGLLVSSVALAKDTEAFQAKKDREISNIQERLQMGQEHLSCVQAATDQAALKACNQAAKAKKQAFGEKMKAEHGK